MCLEYLRDLFQLKQLHSYLPSLWGHPFFAERMQTFPIEDYKRLVCAALTWSLESVTSFSHQCPATVNKFHSGLQHFLSPFLLIPLAPNNSSIVTDIYIIHCYRTDLRCLGISNCICSHSYSYIKITKRKFAHLFAHISRLIISGSL